MNFGRFGEFGDTKLLRAFRRSRRLTASSRPLPAFQSANMKLVLKHHDAVTLKVSSQHMHRTDLQPVDLVTRRVHRSASRPDGLQRNQDS